RTAIWRLQHRPAGRRAVGPQLEHEAARRVRGAAACEDGRQHHGRQHQPSARAAEVVGAAVMRDCGNGIAYDEESHTYTLDGKVVPGVTRPLEVVYDFRFVKQEDLDRASDFGRKMHKTIQLFEA